MTSNRYSIEVSPERKIVEVKFASAINLDTVEDALNQLKEFIVENYRIKIVGYINREYNYIRAFRLALSLFGNEGRVIFENKARFSRSERKLIKGRMLELKNKGYSAKQISEEMSIPLKTIYRWFNEET